MRLKSWTDVIERDATSSVSKYGLSHAASYLDLSALATTADWTVYLDGSSMECLLLGTAAIEEAPPNLLNSWRDRVLVGGIMSSIPPDGDSRLFSQT